MGDTHCRVESQLKKICAITMVRDDEFFLRKWVSYYGSQLGEENCYVFFDGKDQQVPDFCRGVNTELCERKAGNVARADKARINFLSDRASGLLREYDMVIGTDVDEFLVVEPDMKVGLREFLSNCEASPSVSALGIDVGQHLDKEEEIDPDKPFLQQRSFGYLSTRYTKASVISRPVRWGSGFHRVKGANFHIKRGLYLFHFGSVDINMLMKRMNETDRIANGWSRHLRKRARTMRIITAAKPAEWDKAVAAARIVQSAVRPIYAINKPAMFGVRVVVRIPSRFSGIL